MKVLRIET